MDLTGKTRRRVTAMVTLPPPTTGQTTVTKRVLEEIRRHARLRVFDYSGGGVHAGWRWRIRKARRNLMACLWLLMKRREDQECVYSVANDGIGLIYNALQSIVARIRGFRLVFHHHSFAYLHELDPRMARLIRWSANDTTHVLLGPEMQDRFVELYGPQINTIVVENYFLAVPSSQSKESTTQREAWTGDRPLRLGHLSNLTIEKGIGRVIESFEKMAQQGCDVELHIAGPARSIQVEQLIQAAREKHGDSIKVYGPIYDADKAQFFEHIDVFLFPTLYRTEAQPLVVLEAMAAGNPVVTTDIACIPSLVGTNAGVMISAKDHFAQRCCDLVIGWLSSPENLAPLALGARRRADQVIQQAPESLDRLMNALGLESSTGRDESLSAN